MAILTKQVLLFSLVPFSILFIHLLYIKANYHLLKSLKYFLLFVCFALTPIVLFDWWLILPDKYPISHLQRVYLEGSEHINKISGNGFNIWVLFFNDMLNTSSNLLLGFVSPKYIGIFLFLFSFAVITYLHLYKIRTQTIQLISNSFLANYILYLALINLSFNVFLTGTHDRYLYHFYPFLFIAIIAMGQDFTSILKNKILYIGLVGAILYGAFILSILMMVQPAYSNKVLAVFHFCLLVYLFFQYFIKSQKTKNAN